MEYRRKKFSQDGSRDNVSRRAKLNFSKLQWALLGPISFTLLAASYFLSYPSTIGSTIAELLDNSPVVILPQGRIHGTILNHGYPNPIEGFLGVPYALPPTGDRRFRHLTALPDSSETIRAREYGNICPGKAFRFVGTPPPMSEDCLTANIYRPQGAKKGAKLPVALHLHGGAFNRGHGYMQDTGSMLAWSEEPIGALGFLPSNVTASEGLLNLALHDNDFFFQWVKNNIASFGGDPDNITIFGLSAGAHAIGHHLMDMDRKPIFKAAILESGASSARAVHHYSYDLHEKQFREYVDECGCSAVKDSKIFTCLRRQPSDRVIAASFKVFDKYNPTVRWAFQPVIDGDFIRRSPTESWKLGKWHKMPIITGFTTNEATSYVPSTVDTPKEFEDFWRTLVPTLSEEEYKKINYLYPDPSTNAKSPYIETRNIDVGSQYKRLEAAYANYAYICPVRATAHHASLGQEEPIYVYHWALNKTVQGGANHGDNQLYEAYARGAREFSSTQEKMSGTLHAYWTSFITQGGDPNKLQGRFQDRAKWTPFKVGKPKIIMALGEGNDERAGGSGLGVIAQMKDDSWRAKECDFWWAKAEKLHQ
ncbi:hypothetical protein HYFRA_00000223 [Hymenoscyphus fraxineus]|uniref:Carboxylic ester hydrolase n=1 Tax=Hymenoscyphus fraxineus TaxID=746836 RepID=A0A9N9L4B0_9HELO|nr:hypothetical protein HYFRA_00000223 [Hymenoscyphus fraxineus]